MYQLKIIRVGDSDPRLVLVKAIHHGDTATADMFNTQSSLFHAPTNVHGYTDKHGRVVPAHTAVHAHKLPLAITRNARIIPTERAAPIHAKPEETMIQLTTVNTEIAKRGISAELVKGEGYFYFIGDAVEHADTSSVYVNSLNELSLDRWMEELADFVAESGKAASRRGVAGMSADSFPETMAACGKNAEKFSALIGQLNEATEAKSIIKSRYAELRSGFSRMLDVAAKVKIAPFYHMGEYEDRPEPIKYDVSYSGELSAVAKAIRICKPYAGKDEGADAVLKLYGEWTPLIEKLNALKEHVTTTGALREAKKVEEAKANPVRKVGKVVNDAIRAELVEYFTGVAEGQIFNQFATLVAKFGTSMGNVANSRTYQFWSETIRPLCDAHPHLDEKGKRGTTYAINSERVKQYSASYGEAATGEIIAKIGHKVGELEDGKVHHISGPRFSITGKSGAHLVNINQEMIVNVSVKGRLFNQFPARIYVDGKFMSAADFDKLIKGNKK